MPTNVSIEEEVLRQLPWLLTQFGFIVIDARYDASSFGDSYVVLQAPTVRLRFVRDRGQVSLEIGINGEPVTWWHFEHFCELLEGQSLSPILDLETIGRLLQNNMPALVDCLGAKFSETKREIEIIAEKRRPSWVKGRHD